jgi:hypothetical protein
MLIKGKGATPKDGGCLVQIANWLADPTTWTDEGLCVYPLLAKWAIWANDVADNEHRHQLALLAPRLSGTRLEQPLHEEAMDVLLRQYLQDHRAPVCPSSGGLAWTVNDDGVKTACIDLGTIMVVDQDGIYGWLEGIIDYYDYLTGRNSRELLSEQEWLEIKELVGQ